MPFAGALADRADPARLVVLGAVLVAALQALYGLLGALAVAQAYTLGNTPVLSMRTSQGSGLDAPGPLE